jgi:hypothetical protein
VLAVRAYRVDRKRCGGDPVCDKCEYVRLIGSRRSTCLCDVGATHYVATVTVDRDGNETFWLARKDLLGRPDADHGNENPPHERLGRLPQAIREKVWGDALLCGRPTATGRPCRQRVAEPSQSCGVHRWWPR